MKAIFKILIISLVFISCSKDEDYTTISFQEVEYNVTHTPQKFDIILDLDKVAPADVTIPLIFTGNTERLSDFKCTTELFIRKGDYGGVFEFEVLVNSNNLPPKNVSISLNLPSNYKFGSNSKTVININ